MRTIERTIIESVGSGVVYTSPDGCIMVGIGGRSDPVFGVPGLSSPLLQRDVKLGRCWLPPNDIRLNTRRTTLGCVVSSSSSAESWTPNDLRGMWCLSFLGELMIGSDMSVS